MSNADIHLEVLSQHYSETFALLKNDVGKRDRLFLYMLIIICLILLYMSAPDAVSDWVNSFVSNQSGNRGTSPMPDLLDGSFLGTVLWLGLLSLAHTYFQTVLHIERQYDYVYHLEVLLSASFDEKAFIREGKHYRVHKRSFAKWTKAIFWVFFPLLFLVFIVAWLVFLFGRSHASPAYLIMDSLIALSTLVSMGYYLLALFKKK